MTAIDRLIEILSRLPMDEAGRAEADKLVEAARKERTDLLVLVKGAHDLIADNWCEPPITGIPDWLRRAEFALSFFSDNEPPSPASVR